MPKTITRRRRESKENPDAKPKLDIDDMISMVTYLDENKYFEQLPMFVAADPDLLPSSRIQEGDMLVMLRKLSAIEDRCSATQLELQNLRNQVARTSNRNLPATTLTKEPKSQNVGAAGGSGTLLPSDPSLAIGRSEFTSVSSAIESDGDMDDGFIVNESRKERQRRSKRLRESTSPGSSTYATVTSAVAGASSSHMASASVKPAAVHTAKPTARPPARKQVMIGQSSTTSLKASNNLDVKKSVFRIGNIDSSLSEDDVKQYVESLGVRVLSCFERTSTKSRFVDNKSFRICIFDSDKSKMLCSDKWTSGISIQQWVFKPKATVDKGNDNVVADTIMSVVDLPIVNNGSA